MSSLQYAQSVLQENTICKDYFFNIFYLEFINSWVVLTTLELYSFSKISFQNCESLDFYIMS